MSDHPKWEVHCICQLSELDSIENDWDSFLTNIEDSQNHQVAYVSAFIRREQAQPVIIIIRVNGIIKAIAPFLISKNSVPVRLSVIKLGSVKLRRLRLIGNDLSVANDVDTAEVFRLVFGELQRQSEFDLLDLQDAPEDGRLLSELDKVIGAGTPWRLLRKTEPQVCHEIRFADTFEDYLMSLTSKNRSNLRRRKKKLSTHFKDDVRLLRISSPDQVRFFLSTCDEIFKNAWQAKAYGEELRDKPENRAYYTRLAEQGWLRSYILFGEQDPLAFQVGLQVGAHYNFIETGYDAKWGNLGPGTVLEFMVLEELHSDNPPKSADFGFGDAEYKRILANHSHNEFAHVYLARGLALKPRMLTAVMALIVNIERAGRQILKWTRMEDMMRRRLKRKP